MRPEEIYNLGAQSHVKVSFETPEYTANSDALGTLRLLEAIRLLGLADKTRFYQASTSELFGKVREVPQSEKTPFYPRSPYAAAKAYAYWVTVNYREAYSLFASNGILFNHESPLRGETFVTRKITMAAARIALGFQERLHLGNLDALRDWGHARDYVKAMWMVLNHHCPDDFVIATGEQHSVRSFCQKAFEALGITIEWVGSGLSEQGVVAGLGSSAAIEGVSSLGAPGKPRPGSVVVAVDPAYFRPTEVETLLGDPGKARKELGWRPRICFDEMVREMVAHDLDLANREALYRKNGFKVEQSCEAAM